MGIFNSFLGDKDQLADSKSGRQNDTLKSLEELLHKRQEATLEVLSANVMVADANNVIVDVNSSTIAMMKNAQADIRKDLPNFNVDNLVGSKIDIFHHNPEHQRAMLDKLESKHTARISVGGREFRFVANPLFDKNKARLGTVVEWEDMTEFLRLEAEKAASLQSQLETANENAKVKSALDQLGAAIMMVDQSGKIDYANKALIKLFSRLEGEVRSAKQTFLANAIVGSPIENYLQAAALKNELMNTGSGQNKIKMDLNGKQIILISNAVQDLSGARIGTAIEWKDKTDEFMFENSILKTVDDAINGDLHGRIPAGSKSDYIANMSAKLNTLFDTFQNVITETGNSLEALSQGKLTRKITPEFKGSYGKLKSDMNQTIDQLVSVLNEIRDCAGNVKTGSGEISSGNMNLSQRTEEQAASLEETSAAMEQITTTVQQNAANAVQANTLARGARESAENGGDVVNNAVAAMQAISESSNKINDIIGVIDEIAFQTNLLALNAAVEAARAGDQGRGFAVVADEVRNLAGRSATAAKEIKELIKDSGEKVKEGSRLVNKSGETLGEIVTAVKKVNDIVAEISTASDEQATGLDEINRAVGEMDEMTQQNAALVEEAAAASESLGDQAQQLDKLISYFDMGAIGNRASTPAPSYRPKPAATIKAKPYVAKSAASKPIPKAAPKPKPAVAKKAVVDEDDKNWAEF